MRTFYLGFRQEHDEVVDILERHDFSHCDHLGQLRRCGRLFMYFESGMDTCLSLQLRYPKYLDTNFWGRVDKRVRAEAEFSVMPTAGFQEYRRQIDLAELFHTKLEVIVAVSKILQH